MKKLFLIFLIISLVGCAQKKEAIQFATNWQQHITQEEIDAVGLDKGIGPIHERTKQPGFVWNEQEVDNVMDYIYERTTYALFINPCCNVRLCCGPVGMHKYNYIGHCYSRATYMWCTFKYLNYPYNARIQVVRLIPGINHVVFIIELPDKHWKMYNTQKLLGLEKLDELIEYTWVEFDTQGIWFPSNLQRGKIK